MNERNVQARGDISGRVFTGDLYININSDKVEITYIKKEINGINHEDILKEINISLATNTELNQKALPFIPPDKYNQWKDERNLFLYGIGGAGKTRSILKILEDKINEKDSYNNLKSRNIYLIYPQKITEAKIEKTTISKIVKELHENDILIWDNFPLDIEGKQEPEIGWKLLSNLSSGNKATLLVTLYSDYFELYNPEVLRKGLSELRMELVTYSKEKIEEFLDVYGNNISEFKCLYKEFVEKNKHIISQNLWRNEPTPLTVYIYYTELVKTKKNSWLNPAITLSEKLPTSDRYYTEQFKSIFSYRRNESEFLCTLKLCYDLGIERTSGSYLKKKQREIFGSDIPEYPSKDLSAWVFLSGAYYNMYDIARNAIEYPEDKKPEIIRYLSRLDLDHLNSTDLGIKMTIEGIFYRIGLFIGENIQFAESVSYDDIFSMDIYNKLNNPDFARGLARGLTHNFHSFDKTIQKKLWDLGERIIEFGFGLSYGFGYNLLSLNPETRKRLWDFLRIKNRFEEGFSYGLISESGLLPYLKDYLIINEILDVAVMKDDSYLGRAFGNIFSHINEEIQKRTFNLIEKDQNSRFAGGFSHGLIECFSYLDNKIKEKIWNLVEIDKNTEFANGFGWNISRNFSAIDKETKEKIWEAVEKNPQFANGFASKLEETFSSLDKETKEKIWEAVEKNPQFANGFTSNIKFSSLDEESQKKMMDICQRNHAIAYRLGESFNYDKYFDLFYRHGEDRIKLIKKMFDYGEEQFNSLSKEIQFRLLELAEDNKDFAKSSGFKNKKSLFWKRIKLNHPKRKLSILNRIYQFLHPLISRFSHTDHD